jgi:hypothetical protein
VWITWKSFSRAEDRSQETGVKSIRRGSADEKVTFFREVAGVQELQELQNTKIGIVPGA